jgi:hypothetical protein
MKKSHLQVHLSERNKSPGKGPVGDEGEAGVLLGESQMLQNLLFKC